MRHVLWICPIVLGLVISSSAVGSGGITVDRLREHVSYLASDSLAGRETGEPGAHKAEKYIARQLRRAGLTPLPGRNSFYVDFTLYRQAYDARATSVTLTTPDGKKLKGNVGEDFRPFPFSDDGTVAGQVVFAGYGITSKEHEWDDYADLDVEGKLVLLLRHEPGENDPDSSFDGTASTSHATFVAKARNAEQHGARGMLLVTDPLHHTAVDDLRIGGALRLDPPDIAGESAEGEEDPPFVAVQISQKLAGEIAAAAGQDLKAVQRSLDDGTPVGAFSLGSFSARLGVQRSRQATEVPARNVAAFLEGSDPQLKDEWIVVGAHHDHVGGYRGEGDTIFNGADDNASGTSGVLELAAAFAAREPRPRRSMVFVTFSGEEKGLLGSRAMVGQRLIAVERVVFMFNLDMIGRNPDKDIKVYGDGYARGLREIVEAANAAELPLDFAGSTYAGNSDHNSFYEEDIPFMFFFTGIHEDYHQLGDHIGKLNFERMQSILRTAYAALETLADAPEALRFVHHVNWLGVQVEVLQRDGAERAVVTVVDEGSRAMKAGLAGGDVLTGFGEEALDDAGEVGKRFRGIDPGTRIALGLRRGNVPLTIDVERARVGYLGVVPAAVDDDLRQTNGLGHDEGVLLRQVVGEGPAAEGGLETDDIVLQIAGRSVDPAGLGRTLSQIGAGETVEVMVLRDGERLTFPVTLGERPQR